VSEERRYFNGYVDREENYYVLLYRDENDRVCQVRRQCEWSVYFRKHDIDTHGFYRKLRDSYHVSHLAEEGDYYRIGFRAQDKRYMFCFDDGGPCKKLGFQAFEADLDPIRRFFSDSGAHIARPRRVYLDIETDSRCAIQTVKDGNARVLCWTLVSQDGKRIIHDVLNVDSDEDEVRLLRHLWQELEAFDHVVAWMSPMRDEFDFDVIKARSARLGIRIEHRRWVWLDHLKVYKKMNMQAAESGDEKRSFKLQNIAMAELGEGKDDFDGRKTWEAWVAGGDERKRMQRYNIKDAVLLQKLEAKTGYIELFVTVCEVCRLFPNSASLAPMQQMDGFLLRLAVERGQHFGSRDPNKKEEDEKKFKGAWVMEPKRKGILRNVHVCDFASLYPSIILTWNMSPDTIVGHTEKSESIPPECCRAPTTGITFSTKTEGILVGALKTILRMRAEWDKKKSACAPGTPEWHDADRRSKALKVLANSFYGLLGNTFSRFHDESIAESITQTGVWLLQLTLKEAEEKFKMFPLYGDTDSGFVMDTSVEAFRGFVEHMNKNVYPAVLKEQGCIANHISLAYEKAFDRLVFVSAKRYIGSYSHYKGKAATKDSKPEIKGLEYKRGDALKLARELQAEVIDMLVGGLKTSKHEEPTEKLEDYHVVLDRLRSHVIHDTLPLEEVVLSKSISKSLKEYPEQGAPAHVRVARMLKDRGYAIGKGQRVEYVVTNGDASPMEVIAADDYTGEQADRFYLWENLLYPPTQRLLESAFPDHDWKVWEKVRPVKRRSKVRRRMIVSEKQTAMFSPDVLQPIKHKNGVPTVAELPDTDAQEYIVHIDERRVLQGLGPVNEILKRHPGPRRVLLKVYLANGMQTILESKTRTASGSAALHAELAPYRPVSVRS